MRRLATCLMVGLSCMPVLLAAQQPPLAEVARKEAERRKAVKATGKVYTNADVKKGVPLTTAVATPTASAQEPAAKPAQAEAKPAAPAAEVRDEAWWRKRMGELQEQLSRSRLFAEALQSRINGLWADFTARDDPAQRAVLEASRNEALAELERVNAEVARQQQTVADFEEEARKNNVPPGWLR